MRRSFLKLMKIRMTRVSLIVLLWILGGQASALSTDGEQPVYIEADWAEADDIAGTAVYKGAVVLKQGSIRVTGDTVTMYYDENHKLNKMVALGEPARFRQLPDGEKDFQHATARRIEFYLNDDLMILLDEAHAWQGKDRITGDRIVFDTVNSRIKARTNKARKSEKSEKSRVRITIAPKSKCSEGQAKASEECRE